MFFAQELKEGLLIAFRAIRANKMRSVLTTLGIIIGIVAVTGMATAIDGLDKAFEKSARAFGTDILYIQKHPWVSNEDWSLIRNRPDIKVEYADEIERLARLSTAAAPVVGRRMQVANGNFILDVNSPDRLSGYPIRFTQNIPSNLTKGSSNVCSALLFGNFADLLVGFWSGIDINIDTATHSSSGGVRVVAFQDIDVAVRHPESFSAALDLTTT